MLDKSANSNIKLAKVQLTQKWPTVRELTIE